LDILFEHGLDKRVSAQFQALKRRRDAATGAEQTTKSEREADMKENLKKNENVTLRAITRAITDAVSQRFS
jgi:hypothetical protein